MSVTLSGAIHGRRIDLDQESLMPDGAAVTVRIAARSLTEKEKRRLVVGKWVLPSETGETPLNAKNFVRRVFLPALKRSKIRDLRWHDLRYLSRADW